MKKIFPGISDADRTLLYELLTKECNHTPARETLEKLLSKGNTLILDKGDTIIAAGEYDPNFYIVIDGLVRCWFWNGDKEEIAYFSTIPTIFHNYNSYYLGEESFYTYEACLPTRVIKVHKKDYDDLLDESHDFALWMLSICCYQAAAFEKKASLDTGSSKNRYDRLNESIPEIFQKVPLGMIASYLKITPQHLSKIRRNNN